MGGMHGVAFQGLKALQRGVQHHIGVGSGQAVDVHMHFQQAGHLAHQTFQPLLDASFDGGLFGVGQLVLQLPQNDMLDHNKIPPAFFLIVAG